jgi:hypothetical protein
MKKQTNKQLVTSLMNNSRAGVLSQAFVLQAIESYSQHIIAASNDQLGGDKAFISPEAWKECARETLEKLSCYYMQN